jgi:hypothetical protein
VDPIIFDDHVPAALTPPGIALVLCRLATSPAQLSEKAMLANNAIDAVLKGIQAWDNTVYISRRGNAGSQPACL